MRMTPVTKLRQRSNGANEFMQNHIISVISAMFLPDGIPVSIPGERRVEGGVRASQATAALRTSQAT
jgi:hypothetical protein